MSNTFFDQLDLSFKPSTTSTPKELSQSQISHYNQQGYISPLDIYSPQEADRNRKYFDFLMEELKRVSPDADSYAINGYHTCCQGLWDIVNHPLILDYVEDLIGPNVICWGTHFFCKVPHDPKSVPWHQDASYWPLTPSRTTTVWLAIDDADEENSAMQFIPGTHRKGHLKWKDSKTPSVLNQEITNIDTYGTPVTNTLKAGQMSLHADMLAHGSTPNHSDRRRCGLTIRYCPPEVTPLKKNWAEQGILCRGRDITGNWAHNGRPESDDVSAKVKRAAIGAN
ncbi:phytanoyl-CoA dioxygenase family protein [Rubellicoccus peritrichatus]|uniref:Phytanoyl-CoA dioxygenase family protein n=1 Tax=Rubellicoccus peritrichatus TaxID=3080537 RepID=A0AAQ3L9D5_9BACT|nr:phytanoyl-CoA dioxygenase family protein [Puniceicoccus sp. CR14]WOO40117.1 phytanoyl-CoA dioxygenase family protein [Puniceicoccus sp. CR14]